MLSVQTDPIIFLVVGTILGGCGFSLWKGGIAERIVGGAVLANFFIQMLISALPRDVQPVPELMLDGVTALALLIVVFIYGRLWLGGVMLLFAIQFTLHAFYSLTERTPDRLHAIINNVDSTGIIWCLIIGTALAWRRRVKAAATSAPKASSAA